MGTSNTTELNTCDADNQGRTFAPGCQRQALGKGSARAMTMKERIKVHVQIERENARKLREWKQKKGGKAA